MLRLPVTGGTLAGQEVHTMMCFWMPRTAGDFQGDLDLVRI